MGKDYMESSLKRFLKRKVKITLGFVVSFLITGMVSFAGEIDSEITGKYLEGLGKGEISVDNNYVTAEIVENNLIITIKDYSDKKFEIDNSLISKKTAETLSKVFNAMNGESNQNVNKGIRTYEMNGGNTVSNEGIIKIDGSNGYGQKTAGVALNYGIIDVGNYGQEIYGGIGINYGVIRSGNGQKIESKNAKGMNYGIIIAVNDGQVVYDDGVAMNYGVIKADKNGQDANNASRILNYGLIISSTGQYISNNALGINYGRINSNSGQAMSSNNKSEHGTALNYGVINSGTKGQSTRDGGKIANYGLITSNNSGQVIGETNDLKETTVVNYGVIKAGNNGQEVNTNKYHESGTIINNGIIIAEKAYIRTGDQTESKFYKNGIALKRENGKLVLNDGTIDGEKYNSNIDILGTAQLGAGNKLSELKTDNKIKEKVTGENLKGHNIFVNNLGNGDKNNQLIIDKNLAGEFENTHITTAVTKDGYTKNEAVIKIETDNNNFTMDKSTMVGYFEKDGTFLDVSGTVDLTGEANITVIGDGETKNITAVNLKDGTLNLTGDTKIIAVSDNEEINTVAVNLNNGILNLGEKTALTTENVNLEKIPLIKGNINLEAGENKITLNDKKALLLGNILVNGGNTTLDGVNSDSKLGAGINIFNGNINIGDNISLNGNINFGVGEGSITVGEKFSKKDFTGDVTGDVTGKSLGITYKIDGKEKTLDEQLNIFDGISIVQLNNENNNFDFAKIDKKLSGVKGGSGNDTFTINTDEIEDVYLVDGGDGNDRFNIGSLNDNSEKKVLKGTFKNLETININNNITFASDLKIEGKDITINLNNGKELFLAVDYNKRLDGKVIGHALYNNGIKFNNSNGKVLVDIAKASDGTIISLGTEGNKTEFGKIGKEHLLESGSSNHHIELIDGDIHVESEKHIMGDKTPLKYIHLDKIYQSIVSADKLKEMADTTTIIDKTKDEAIKAQLEFYGKIYHSTPYAYSNDVSKKSADLITESIMNLKIMPEYKHWVFGGSIAGQESDSDSNFYGLNYYNGIDIGKNKVSADTNIYGAYAFGKYGIGINQSVGFAFAGTRSDTDISGNSKLEGDAVYISAFAEQEMNNLKLTAGISYQHSFYDSTRNVSNDYQRMSVDKKYEDDLISIFAGGKYSYHLGNNFFAEPKVKLSVTHVMQDSIDEGDNGTLTIETDKKDFTFVEGEVGVDLVKKVNLSKGALSLKVGTSLVHSIDGYEEEYLIGRITGSSKEFEMISPEDDRTRVKFTVGTEYEMTNGVFMNLYGNYTTSSHAEDYTVSFGAGYRF